ncbi:Uncharacterized protein BP5553_07577 [Venustampulla echinocandica]|uniref:tyrosinase n=1 Tax=Venustampulla echinocandica TaxID=2656787 RepID=A0A370TGX1_9HELO|nr:Uncharacterized protein BP5553_07577 [Venustampulla echinocandica]RDL34449.1 Uncharacterized protein BP5553_07577 [Venustampulla echinocandica]
MTFAITGIKKGLGPGEQVPLRREIDEWWDSKDKNDLFQKSLYIYALHEFKKMDPKDQKSYFAVAGIHGQPLDPWDTTQAKSAWYCTHGTPLFPPWHRPYLLLYEQRLYEIMLELIPRTFAQQDIAAATHAAETWRLPYWDWAMKKPDWHAPTDKFKLGPNVPYLLTVETVEVMTKTGVATVDNPMWKFSVPASDPNKKTFGNYGITEYSSRPFQLAKATSRHPSTLDPRDPNFISAWVDGEKQNWDTITGELRGAQAVDSNTLPEAVYRLFLEEYLLTWNEFSTDGFRRGQPAQSYSSLEDIHGNLHVFTGGNGQMGSVPVAAFDPIFWLHHCNVDRLFAIYQDLYPSKYVEKFTIPGRGSKPADANSSLAPFHMDANGTPWTAAACRYQQKLGYTYPELQKWLDIYKTNGAFDAAKYQKSIRTTLELKYSTTGKSTLLLRQNNKLATTLLASLPPQNLLVENFPPVLAKQAREIQESAPAPPVEAAPPTPAEGNWEAYDYVINVLYDRFALGGYPYAIRFFLGEVPVPPPSADAPASNQPTPLPFADTPTQVGLVYNFSAPSEFRGVDPSGCANCIRQQDNGELSTGQCILTDYLVEHIQKDVVGRGIQLKSLEKDEVVNYLKANLHWRITDQNSVIVPKESVANLKVSVAVGHATHFLQAATPSKYENYEVLWEVTEGRLAGAVPGDLS